MEKGTKEPGHELDIIEKELRKQVEMSQPTC